MSLFSKKPAPPMNSDEYEKLAKRVTDLESQLDKFVVKFMSLRGLIHRKKFDDPMIDSEESKAENLKEGVLLPDTRGIND